MASGRIKGITIEIDGNTTKLTKALSNVNKSLSQTSTSLKDVDKLLKFNPKSTELLTQKSKLLKQAIEDTTEKLNQEKEALKQLEKGPQTEETIRQQEALKREIIDTENALKQAKQAFKDFGSVASQQVKQVGEQVKQTGENIKEFGNGVADVGSNLTTKLTLPLVAVGGMAVKEASSFEDAFAKVSTIADETQLPLEELKKQILDLSNETGVGAEQISESVYSAISGGQQTADAVNFVATANKLARSGFTDVANATDVLTTALNAYGMEADQASHVSDVLINTQNLGKTTVDELASSMGKVIPTANMANVKFEELSATYAILTKTGVNTQISTTWLNAMLSELNSTGSDVDDTLKKMTKEVYGTEMSFSQMQENGYDIVDALNLIDESAKRDGQTLTDVFSSDIAGRGASVLHANSEELREFTTAMYESSNGSGATQEAYEKLYTSSFKFQQMMNELKNTMSDLGATILEMVLPYLEMLSEKVSQLREWWTNLDDGTKQTIVTFGAIVASVGPILVIVGKLIAVIGTIISAIGTVIGWIGSFIGIIQTVVAVLGGPLTLAITAIIAIGVLLWKNWDTVKTKAIELWGNLKVAFENIKITITTVWNIIKTSISNTVANIKTVVVSTFNNVKSTITNIVTSIRTTISNTFNSIVSAISNSVSNIWSSITNTFNNIKSTIWNVVDSIKSAFNFQWSLPKIKLPHFSFSGSANPIDWITKGQLPKISVAWYRKAYDTPVLFNQPTVIPTVNGFKGFGDGNGAEVVMSLNRLEKLVGANNGPTINMTVNGASGQNVNELANIVIRKLTNQIERTNGRW